MKVKLGLDSQAKSVTAHVEIEGEGESIDELENELRKRFNSLEEYALARTMKRV
jgi:hypothetical protein